MTIDDRWKNNRLPETMRLTGVLAAHSRRCPRTISGVSRRNRR